VVLVSQKASATQTIANAHMLFNGLGVLLMLPFLGLFNRLLHKLVPEKKAETDVRDNLPVVLHTPASS
jgi:Na+/phosphate symporter